MNRIIECNKIEISGDSPRHEIVKRVVDTFIKAEYQEKGKGVGFRYPVENLSGKKRLFIVRPGHKKNFDFKVEVTEEMRLEEGSHKQIALDLRTKKQEDQKEFKDLLQAIGEIYRCSENDIGRLLEIYPDIKQAFQTGADVEVLLKVIKWLFIMEDIVYWDNEGRAFLYNFLIYVANERYENRLEEAMMKVKDPDRLKSFMKKSGIAWLPYEG